MIVAALDLGTNSFLCLIAEVQGGRISRVIEDHVEVVRLGQDVQRTGQFHPEALARAKACLERFKIVIDRNKPDRILAMATSAARDVSNGQALFEIGNALNIPIEIIPGDREAEITYMGATSHLPADGKTRLIIDVGGGSTEYIVGQDKKIKFAKSLNLGCVRMTESLIKNQPTPESELNALSERVRSEIDLVKEIILKSSIDEVIAVAGTPSAIAAIDLGGFDAAKVDGYKLEISGLRNLKTKLAALSVAEKIKVLGVEKGRADVILVGCEILYQSLLNLGLKQMTVSTKGVRYGVAIELANRKK